MIILVSKNHQLGLVEENSSWLLKSHCLNESNRDSSHNKSNNGLINVKLNKNI